MASPKAGNLQGVNTCSVCLDLVTDTRERSIAKLICGHQFHLDCIGSAFNAKGSMQCPNCRQIENGEWLYGNGRLQLDNSMTEDMMHDEEYIDVEYDIVAGVSELFFPDNLMIGHNQWCPHQGLYTQLSVSFGTGDQQHPIFDAEVVLDVLVSENSDSSSEPSQRLPVVLAHAPSLSRHTPGVESVGLHEGSAHHHHGAPYRPHFTPSSSHQPPAVLGRNGVAEGFRRQEESWWPRVENQSSGHIPASQSRHNGRRRRLSASPPAAANIYANQFTPGPMSRDYPGTSAAQNPVRDAHPSRNNTDSRQWRQEGISQSWQYVSREAEAQRRAPPPLSGLYGTHSIRGSELPTHHTQPTSQPLHLYTSAEDTDVQLSTSFYHPR